MFIFSINTLPVVTLNVELLNTQSSPVILIPLLMYITLFSNVPLNFKISPSLTKPVKPPFALIYSSKLDGVIIEVLPLKI